MEKKGRIAGKTLRVVNAQTHVSQLTRFLFTYHAGFITTRIANPTPKMKQNQFFDYISLYFMKKHKRVVTMDI